ncbi:GNAT family N-acetyltransferase [Paenibacillus harenae]|uniref:GNAT family N-acetyltransferase n=1 Tax=Paenibacillus harenae TaxID=306543 RepID=UPI002794D2B0|nr:GNAT family N-acetyltransferase [Paenibacillus harenae]MDQ0060070.1 GNAT superfamily N-acetyltransferase [Paenibacillus harenae]
MIRIIDIRERPDLQKAAVDYFWQRWGSDSNRNFYRDCIERSCDTQCDVPRFYLALEDDQIIGAYALLRSDLNSRQDLFPWFACLFVEPEHRGKRIGALLQDHAIVQARQKGYERLYLCTDLTHYYEKTNWSYIGKGYSISDDETRIYEYKVGVPSDDTYTDGK